MITSDVNLFITNIIQISINEKIYINLNTYLKNNRFNGLPDTIWNYIKGTNNIILRSKTIINYD